MAAVRRRPPEVEDEGPGQEECACGVVLEEEQVAWADDVDTAWGA